MNPEIERSSRMSEEQALQEVEKMKEVMQRRRVIKPRARDYEEAHQKTERQKVSAASSAEAIELKPIEQMFDAALFDWDGVLYDSMENIGAATSEVCRHFGIDLSPEKFRETYDAPYWEHYESVGVPASTEEQRQYIYKLYHDKVIPALKECLGESDLYPEVPDILRELKGRGLRIGIVSAHKPEDIEEILDKKGIRNLVDNVSGLAHSKSEAIKGFYNQSQVELGRVLMFGDLPSDLRDARQAGIKVAAVARFEVAGDRLGSYDPDYLFKMLGPEILRPQPFKDRV